MCAPSPEGRVFARLRRALVKCWNLSVTAAQHRHREVPPPPPCEGSSRMDAREGPEAQAEGGAGRTMASSLEPVKFEAAVVCSVLRPQDRFNSPRAAAEDASVEPLRFLVDSFESAGLKVQILHGMDHKVFIKIAASEMVIGRAAETLRLKKLTTLGLQTVFDWELRDSFMRQPHDQALFSWTERYYLLHYIIHSLKLEATAEVQFEFTNPSGRPACFALAPGVPLMSSLEEAGFIVDIFPSHDEQTRKDLLHEWSLNWSGGTSQPLDAVYSYLGPKIALYFAFLEMYTNWLIFPAVTGTLYFLVDLGKWSLVIPPLSAVTMVSWAALFLQFWKRRNLSILERWELRVEEDEIHARMAWDSVDEEPLIEQEAQAPEGSISGKGVGIDSSARRALNKEEWTDRIMIVRNSAIVFLAVMLFQIPFELLYAAFSQQARSTIAKLFSISCYLFCIQKFKVIGGKLAVRLNNAQTHVSSEAAADSLIYKVFWIYFVQSYIGVFYHAFVLQDFKLLRQTLIDRMLVAQVINNVMESLVPYISYLYASRRTINSERKEKGEMGEKVTDYSTSRVEKEYLKPRYITSIADDQHEGLFDDYLELALQFGMVVMFASFFPLVAVLALLNNLMEIRSDSFKLLEMMKRPVPHIVGSIGAWLHIFQYLSGAAIVSNCLLLLLMFDKDGERRMDPGLAGVLVLEHALLAARFGLSWFVPEVPAWVKAKRRKRRRMQEGYSLHVLRSISKKMLSSRQSM